MVTKVAGGIITDQMLTGSIRYFEIDGGGANTEFQFTIADGIAGGNSERIASASVAAGGTGYSVGDTLTATTGTGTQATFRVTEVNGGAVTQVAIISGGSYTVLPTEPIVTTGGAGNATLNIEETTSVIQIPNYTENGEGYFIGLDEPVPGSAAEQALEVLSSRANIVQIAIVSDAVIQVAVENTTWGWETIDDSGPADTDLAAALQALGTVNVPDESATGGTVDLSGATVVERFFSNGIA